MRQGPSNRRARGRGSNSGRRGNLPNRNQTFDSNGPDVRIRGTAFQVNEKYQALARDASASGDRIMAENYLQHAEHYYRIIAAINDAQSQQQAEGRDGHRQRDGHRDGAHRENGHRDGGQREAGQRLQALIDDFGGLVAALEQRRGLAVVLFHRRAAIRPGVPAGGDPNRPVARG